MPILTLALIIFLLYYAIQTIVSLANFRRIVDGILAGTIQRVRLYRDLMLGLWIPALAVLLLTAFGQFSLADVRLVWFRPHGSPWLVIASAVLAGLYFLFLAFRLWALRRNARQGIGNLGSMPERIRAMVPVTVGEKREWVLASVSAGITEELLFRGFLLYALDALFPGLPVIAVLAIATVLFGLGHLYQGMRAAVQPLVIGLLFGVMAIAFGTILPCIVLHAMQDLCAVFLINEDK